MARPKKETLTTATTTVTSSERECFYELADGVDGWHWCLWSGNGRMIARNPEPYETKKHAIQALKSVAGIAAKARVVTKASPD